MRDEPNFDQSTFRIGDRVAVTGVLEMMPGGSSTTLGVRVSRQAGGIVPLKDCQVVDHAAVLSNGDTVTHSTFTRGETGVIQMLVNDAGLPSGIPTKALVSSDSGGRLMPLGELKRVPGRGR